MKKIFILLAITLFTASFVMAVTPIQVPDNPTCADLGYNEKTEFKIDPPIPGDYDIDGVSVFTWVSSDLIYFNWSSTTDIDVVVCKGSNSANIYEYDPASYGDDGLHCPINPSGGPAEVSHITLCFEEVIPEFTTIGALLALGGAGLFALKKRRR